VAVLNPVDGSEGERPMMVIDGGDLACGELLLLVHRQIRDLPAGTTVGILTTDLAAEIDLPAWCHLTGHRYRGRSSPAGPIAFELVDHSTPVHPDRPWHLLPSRENTV
jgi:tRNA 2-thiouridine synthesizing protein A